MGTIISDIKTDFGGPVAETTDRRQNWHGLCVCGHIDRYHSETVGGLYKLPEPMTVTLAGLTVNRIHTFHGCVGALRRRGGEETVVLDREAGSQVFTLIPTCPCVDMRQVASVDRPNRYFNQPIPADPDDGARHPFVNGIRAFYTHLSRRKAATDDESWAEEELDRRLRLDSTVRGCSISGCKVEGADVWPTYVNGELLSEMRCSAHAGRRRP